MIAPPPATAAASAADVPGAAGASTAAAETAAGASSIGPIDAAVAAAPGVEAMEVDAAGDGGAEGGSAGLMDVFLS